MKDYVSIFLDKKFPNQISVREIQNAEPFNVTIHSYEMGEKKLFIRVLGGSEFFYHFYEAKPDQLQMWFQLTLDDAEKKIIDWATDKIQKQESQGIYGV